MMNLIPSMAPLIGFNLTLYSVNENACIFNKILWASQNAEKYSGEGYLILFYLISSKKGDFYVG